MSAGALHLTSATIAGVPRGRAAGGYPGGERAEGGARRPAAGPVLLKRRGAGSPRAPASVHLEPETRRTKHAEGPPSLRVARHLPSSARRARSGSPLHRQIVQLKSQRPRLRVDGHREAPKEICAEDAIDGSRRVHVPVP